MLLAGADIDAACQAAAKLAGVTKVHKAQSEVYAHALAEPLADLLVSLAGHHDHLLAASTATGKNVMPRVAALLDVQPISDISGVIDADTFVRPIYAGNAMATVKSSDSQEGHDGPRRLLRPGGDRGRQTHRSRTSRRRPFPPRPNSCRPSCRSPSGRN